MIYVVLSHLISIGIFLQFMYNSKTMTDEIKNEGVEKEEEVVFEPETESDQGSLQKDLSEVVQKLKAELVEANKQKQEYLDGWMRMKADMVNIKKREEEDRANFIKYAKESVLEDVLPVLESFDMAMINKKSWEKVDANWRSGVEYIAKQLRNILESHGLSELNPIGETFDPSRDDAVEYFKVTDQEQDHKITEVIQKGYKLHDKIIKAPKVKVGEYKA
jgi:molecular chaperone GrpE